MSEELDRMEREAIEMIMRLQEEYRRACEPYVKIITQIRNVRPQVIIVDGKTMIPILKEPL